MVKGIIFDMDGVLFDTEPFYLKRREAFLTSKGIRIDHLSPRILLVVIFSRFGTRS
ncbi:phosphorylated carbohydrates phosphatase [Streptococcus equi subsp. equi]|nr:phosphorylated carbohydrates phosphatase [Streptococcus equi subsp. equi]